MKKSTKSRTLGILSVALGLMIFTAGGSLTAPMAAASVPTKLNYSQIQSDYAAEVVQLVNKERKKAGLKPLTVHTNLTKLAKTKAIDMYTHNYFSHTSSKYGSPFDMMDAYGISFKYAGENLAKGQRSPEQVVKDWMNSSGHKQNILNPHYTLIGVGYYNGLWSQEFIGK
ncbi:hypothetical protein DCC85_12365 [Paenibacillus sp. CAA11]|nr:hypothetical protein DCC85_12365 [Paenibacillus sp. CAA11]